MNRVPSTSWKLDIYCLGEKLYARFLLRSCSMEPANRGSVTLRASWCHIYGQHCIATPANKGWQSRPPCMRSPGCHYLRRGRADNPPRSMVGDVPTVLYYREVSHGRASRSLRLSPEKYEHIFRRPIGLIRLCSDDGRLHAVLACSLRSVLNGEGRLHCHERCLPYYSQD